MKVIYATMIAALLLAGAGARADNLKIENVSVKSRDRAMRRPQP
jgi:hypothetical protein